MAHRIVDNAQTSPPGPVADAAPPEERAIPAVAVNPPATAVAVNHRGPAVVAEPAVPSAGRAVTRRGPGGPELRMRRRAGGRGPSPAGVASLPPGGAPRADAAGPAPRVVPAPARRGAADRPRPVAARLPGEAALLRQGAVVPVPRGAAAPLSPGGPVPLPRGVVGRLPDAAVLPVARGQVGAPVAVRRPARPRPLGPVVHRS